MDMRVRAMILISVMVCENVHTTSWQIKDSQLKEVDQLKIVSMWLCQYMQGKAN